MKTTTHKVNVNYLKSIISVAMLTTMVVTAGAHATPQSKKMKDPFAGDTWHAIAPSWPGTLQFNAKDGKAVLQPFSAPAIPVTYSYTLNPKTISAKSKSIEGKLRMVNDAGQSSEADFAIENQKTMTLRFTNGQRAETYVRFTPQEEKLERERLEKQFKETGRIKPLQK